MEIGGIVGLVGNGVGVDVVVVNEWVGLDFSWGLMAGPKLWMSQGLSNGA